MTQQVWRLERTQCQATQSRKYAIKEVSRRIAIEDGGHSRGAEKKVVSAPARREVERFMVPRGLSERRALRVIRMSASALRERIIALAHRYLRYGAGMINLKLRQAGEQVNHKRVERLYAAARLQVKRRKSKKVPASERKSLDPSCAANQVWLMDFVFDRTEGRTCDQEPHRCGQRYP